MGITLVDTQTPLTICYPLLLLKGVFERNCRCNLNVTSDLSENELVLECNKIDIGCRSSLFKSLITLQAGPNNIRIGCQHAIASLQVNNIDLCIRRAFIRTVYVIFKGSSGDFQAPKDMNASTESACRRLGLAVRLLQTLTAETMLSEVGERRTFMCAGDYDIEGKFKPHLKATAASTAVWCIQASLDISTAQTLPAEVLWKKVALDLCAKFPDDVYHGKWLAVVNCTQYQPVGLDEVTPFLYEDIMARTLGHCALGSGGLALFGSGTLYTWPAKLSDVGRCLSDTSEVDRRHFLDDSAYRGTFWANYATSLGTMLHELGHCFDLDHTPVGIMRRGGDDVNRILGFPPATGKSICRGKKLIRRTQISEKTNLSIFQFEKLIFYETCSYSSQNDNIVEPIIWSMRDTLNSYGNAFWGSEVAQFLSNHLWFQQRPFEDRLRKSKTIEIAGFHVHALSGIRVVQIRLAAYCPSDARILLWNQSARDHFHQLPTKSHLLEGCIVYHKLFVKHSPSTLSLLPLLKSIFFQLVIDALKVVVMDSFGWVQQRVILSSDLCIHLRKNN